jgi:uncharacterized membrane protein
MKRQPTAGGARDRGATAVEFALLLPLLLLVLFGMVDFGRMLNDQITLTQAAREGARLAALGYSAATVTSRAEAAATELSPVTVTVVTSCPAGAGPGVDAVVKASYAFSFVTPVGAIAGLIGGASLGSPITLTAQGEMPCETLATARPGAGAGRPAGTTVGRSASWSPC